MKELHEAPTAPFLSSQDREPVRAAGAQLQEASHFAVKVCARPAKTLLKGHRWGIGEQGGLRPLANRLGGWGEWVWVESRAGHGS